MLTLAEQWQLLSAFQGFSVDRDDPHGAAFCMFIKSWLGSSGLSSCTWPDAEEADEEQRSFWWEPILPDGPPS